MMLYSAYEYRDGEHDYIDVSFVRVIVWILAKNAIRKYAIVAIKHKISFLIESHNRNCFD